MFGALPQPTHVPCPECGASIPRGERDNHACDEAQRIRHELFQLRAEVNRFEGDFAAWLKTNAGRFAVFYAAWQRDCPT
jgi:hypothetical protein